MTLSGKKFNELNQNVMFYKFTNRTETHNGFQCHDGLNEKCQNGASLTFTNLNYIYTALNVNDCKNAWFIREVIIPDDAIIHIKSNYFETNKFILGERVDLHDFYVWKDYNFCKDAILRSIY